MDQGRKRAETTITSLYNIVWGHYSKLMKDKLITVANFDDTQAKYNAIEVLKVIRVISNQLETNK